MGKRLHPSIKAAKKHWMVILKEAVQGTPFHPADLVPGLESLLGRPEDMPANEDAARKLARDVAGFQVSRNGLRAISTEHGERLYKKAQAKAAKEAEAAKAQEQLEAVTQ